MPIWFWLTVGIAAAGCVFAAFVTYCCLVLSSRISRQEEAQWDE